MAATELITFEDATEHLLAFTQGGVSTSELRDIRGAVQRAYREFIQTREWKFYRTIGPVNLVASYSTGTITYDHTGGSSERLLTLATGTWPTWTARGTIIIDSITYSVERRLGDTTATLTATHNPGADVAAGTAYTLYQDCYTLPYDFLKMDEPYRQGGLGGMDYVEPEDWFRMTRTFNSGGTPCFFTIMPSQDAYGAWDMCVWPYPTTAKLVDFIYHRRARPLRFDGRTTSTQGSSTQTVSGSAGSATITGVNTSWTTNMAGSIIRFGDTTNVPTGLSGQTPYVEQQVIQSVESTESLTLTANLVNTHAGTTKYSISDPIDIHGSAIEAFLQCCEWKLSIGRDPVKAGYYYDMYLRSLRQYAENDDVMMPVRYRPRTSYLFDPGWFQPLGDNVT